MRSSRLIIVAGLMLAVAWSCQGDRAVTPLSNSTLEGDYAGTFRYLKIDDTGDTISRAISSVEINFDNGRFRIADELYGGLCDMLGTYKVNTAVEFTVLDSNYTRSQCSPELAMDGCFNLIREPGGIRLVSDQTDSAGIRVFRELNLARKD